MNTEQAPREEQQQLFSVRGKAALVTGASSGVGRQLALLLLREGADVVLTSKKHWSPVEEFVEEVTALRSQEPTMGRAAAMVLDVMANAPEVERQVQHAWDVFGRIDILINNAGVSIGKPVLEDSLENFDKVFGVNVRGLYAVSCAVARRQAVDGRGGSIINMTSFLGCHGAVMKKRGCYAASKVAVQKLTASMAVELGCHGIRVNSLSLGLFPSELSPGSGN
eukprot:SM000077S21619  [mRNA]  locus=s77:605488:606689:- [translate_table: standard]